MYLLMRRSVGTNRKGDVLNLPQLNYLCPHAQVNLNRVNFSRIYVCKTRCRLRMQVSCVGVRIPAELNQQLTRFIPNLVFSISGRIISVSG